jgi:hypothetical protein
MPILLIGSGLVLILTGINGDVGQLYTLVAADFQGKNSFIYWMLAILVLGALGYIKGLENLSKMFMILVLIVLFLDNGGFFQQFNAYVKSTTAAQATTSGGTAA